MKTEEIEVMSMGWKDRIFKFYVFNQRKIHSYIAVFLGVSVLMIAYLTSSPKAEQAIEAQFLFDEWKKNPMDKELQAKMEKSLRAFSGLERAKEAKIVQTLLSAGEHEAIYPAAMRCIERLRKESPFHASFAEATLLIEQKQFQKALELSVSLKEQMDKAKEKPWKEKRLIGGSTVFAANLLRIAILQKQLGNEPGELSAWEELRSLLEAQDHASAAQLKANFAKSQFTLLDYISQRERELIH